MLKKILFIVLLFLVQTVVSAGTNTYTGASGGSWNVSGNWSTGVVPTSADDVVIPSGKTVVLSANVSANSINVSGTMSIANNADININTSLMVVASPNGQINFAVHSIIRLPSDVVLYLQNGSASLNGSCNNNDEIFVGTVQYAVCTGGGALYLFSDIEAAGGINVVTAGVIGTAQSICSGATPATLTSTTAATGSGTITYEWQTNATGSYVTISGETGATYTPPALTATTSYQRRTKSVIGGNTFYSAYTTPVTITVNATPTVAAAGSDQIKCNTTTFTLAGNTPTTGTGLWTLISGTATITTPTSNTSGVTGVTAGTSATLRWTISNGACTSSTDDVILTNNNVIPSAPTGSASQLFCSGATVASLVATGTAIQWYSASSGGSPLATTVALVNGTHYYASQTIGCESSLRLDVTVTISNPAVPTITVAAATCLAAGTSTISNYSASNTYTFNPATPGITINASGLISGMTIGTSYTVTSGNASCTSASSSSFSNASMLAAPVAPTITAGGSTTFCTGGSVTLTSSAGTSYLWSTGATTASINLTTAGSYTVKITNASGCLSAASIATVVTVNALPTITSVSAPAAICKGSSATITLVSITGTGSSYNLYDASSGGVLIGAIPQTLSPTISTTYYLEAVSSAGCLSSSRIAVVVTVRSLVDNTGTGFSSSSFCMGNQATITFDANNGSGVSPYTLSYRNDSTLAIYSQTIPNDNPTIFNLIPNPTATTHYTLLSITDNNGCVNSSPSDNGATATVTSLPVTPTIGTIAQPTCALATGIVDLSGLPAGNWTINPGGITGNTTSKTISGLAVGTYNFTVTNSSGCTSSATANVSINSLVTNTWDGAAWSNVTAPTSDQNIVFDGTFSSSADLAGCSCLVKAGRNVTINPSHTLTITNAVTVEPTGILKFKSDLNPPLSNSASLVQINNVSNSGDIIYERLTNTSILNTDYTYWSSPVASFTLGGVSPNTLANKFYSFDDTTQNWKQESTSTTMIAGRGYIIRGPESFPPNPPLPYLATFTGVPNNGLYTIAGVVADNLYLLGNPYPSAINADQFLNENSGVLDGTLYFWTHNTALDLASSISNAGSGMYAYSSDDYASYNLTGGVGTSSAISDPSYPGGKIPNGKIAAGQGFFASSIVSPSGNTIVYNNDIRITGTSGNNSQFFKTSNIKSKTASVVEKNRIWLALSNNQGAFKQMLVGYLTNATNEYDSRFDGESFDGNTFVDFYSVLQDKNLTIQGRALPFDKNDVVPLGFRSAVNGNFNIIIDQTDGLFTSQDVFLEDKLTNTFFNLKSGSYDFATEKGIFNDRFVLHYTDKTLGIANIDTQTNRQVLVSVRNKQLTVNSFVDSIDKIVIYDLLGRQIFQKNNVNSNEFTIFDIVLSHQTLVVKTVLKSGKTVSHKIVF